MPWIAGMAAMLVAVLMGISPVWGQSAWNGTTKHTTLAAASIAGSGTEPDPYIIDNADKFVAFGYLAGGSTAYWRLTADIDLGGHEWPYSGSAAKTFKGHFDGQNYTVSHYTIAPVSAKANALFGTVTGISATSRAEIKDLKIDDVSVSTTADLGSTTYIGVLVGNASQYADVKNVQVNNITVDVANLTGTNYIGSLVGRLQKNSTVQGCAVSNMSITLSGNITGATSIGGIVGSMEGVAGENSSIEGSSANGTIKTVGNHTFNNNLTIAFGGVVGYVGQAADKLSEVKQCISVVNFNLSGLTPASVSGIEYNLYRSGFVVGGVVGRINIPSRLPEHLYYSGKIYAPFAAVAPIVGVFNTNLNAAAYVYDDYSGVNAANITPQEWKKTDSWYYSDFRIGLSPDVLSQTERSKNFTATPVEEDGVNYLPVDDNTFTNVNKINWVLKKSKTILPYQNNNIDQDWGIYPQWNTNSATYPAYYMYFMQGVNRGRCQKLADEDFLMTLIEKQLIFNPKISRTGDATSGFVFSVDPGEIAFDDDFTITYQWYESDHTTPILGATSNTLSISGSEIESVGDWVWCEMTISGDDFGTTATALKGYVVNVVFVDGTNGNDNAQGSRDRGWTPETAVKTIDNANLLLTPAAQGGSWDNNYVVIIGKSGNDAFKSRGTNPTTYTGKWDGVDYGGIINIVKGTETGANPGDGLGVNGFHNYVSADTKFEYLTFWGYSNTADNNFFDCHGHDVWFGKGLVMANFRNLTKNHGNLNAAQNIPELTVLLTSTNLKEADIRTYTNRSNPQMLTIESGHYGRILAGRFTQAFFNNTQNTSHTILGSAAHPVWAVINVDIVKDNPNWGTVKRDEDPNKGVKTNDFTCDINCIVAGLTDGSIYGDCEINVHGGKVEYIVGGNQGNPAANGTEVFDQPDGIRGKWGQWPNASFFGRSVINVEQDPNLKDITIGNLYAGSLGRNVQDGKDATVVDMYMYGLTEINMKSGTILGNVYGGGAGGVIGPNPWDMHVPYATDDADNATDVVMNGVQYGTWGSKNVGSPLANVTLHNSNGNGVYTSELLNLSTASTTVNISGGAINGSVYGGGCGYVENMPSGVTMQGVGSIFGSTNVNVSGGAIGGSVYGGSEGNSSYFGKINNYGQTISHIAEMNGTVNLNITGTDELYPTIGGNIYGGGAGVASTSSMEYLRIATTGNTDLDDDYASTINITIDLPESHPFLGNVYGGGEMGAVDGTTNISINGGVLGSVDDAGNVVNGSVFGAGKGEPGHPDKAKLTGETYVHVAMSDSDEILGNVYGGGELAQVVGTTHVDITSGPVRGDVYGGGSLADIDGSTEVNLNGGRIHSAYGGGLGARVGVDGATADVEAHVTGNTTVILDGSIVAGEVFGCNNLNGTPRGHAFVDIRRTSPRPGQGASEYDLHAVYGGGNLAAYVPIDPNESAEVLVETCSNSIEEVFGGGNAAAAPNTDVTIWGGTISRVFAGGNGEVSAADVAGNTSLKVYGGTIGEVYGGSNTNGTIGGQISVEVRSDGKDGGEACPMHLGSVYGGGNLAASSAGHMVIGCTGEGEIDAVYGGANKADIDGDVELHIVGGRINNVFGGNNNSGSIRGSISVVVDWDGSCDNNRLVNVYGGGNLADYTAPAPDPDYPKVYVRNAVVEQNVFGGGKGLEGQEKGKVTGNPHVKIGSSEAEESGSGHTVSGHQVTVKNSVYGGGNAAPVVGETHVVADGSAIGGKCDGQFKGADVHGIFVKAHVFGGGLGQTATVSSDTEVRVTGQTTVGGNVYGGGNGGEVGGNTKVVIGQ